MARTLGLLILGALHIAVAIPEPHERVSEPRRSRMREMLHFGGAGCCVLGLGYGFIHNNSTRLGLKAWYFGSLGGLVAAIKCGAVSAEDKDEPGVPPQSLDCYSANYLLRCIQRANAPDVI